MFLTKLMAHHFGLNYLGWVSAAAGIPFLGAIPLTPEIRIACDAGMPLALSATEAESVARYASITELIADRLALK